MDGKDLGRLNDIICEVIDAMTDEEILQYAKEQGIDLAKEQKRFKVMVDSIVEKQPLYTKGC